jgi:cytidine deaminase
MEVKKLDKKEISLLIEKAKQEMKNAFIPESKSPVGAAVLTDKGNVYAGCNIDSGISGLGTCAERCAIDNAVANGEHCFKAILVISNLEKPIEPCGMCLQYIAEFAQVAKLDTEIIMVGSKGKIKKSRINKMLPDAFVPKNFGINVKK